MAVQQQLREIMGPDAALLDDLLDRLVQRLGRRSTPADSAVE